MSIKSAVIIAMVIMLPAGGVGCGSASTSPPPINMSTVHIVWEGDILKSEYAAVYEKTAACLHDNFGYAYVPPPRLVVFSEMSFICRGDVVTGYYVEHDNIIYTSFNISEWGWPIDHEIVHAVTGMGNEGHETDPFLVCAPKGLPK